MFCGILLYINLALGLRGGGQICSTEATKDHNPHPEFSGVGMAELRFGAFGTVANNVDLGFNAGVGAGYGGMGVRRTSKNGFITTDYLGNMIVYETTAEYKLKEDFVRLDLSLFFSLKAKGFVMNIGPRFVMPFATSSSLTIEEATILARYADYAVTLNNEKITGVLPTPYRQQMDAVLPKYHLVMALEAGYEWKIEDNAVGLQAFGDFGVWNSGRKVPDAELLEIGPITAGEDPSAKVTVNTDHLSSFYLLHSFGLRAYYAFCFGQNRGKHSPSQDTNQHKNRYLWY